MGISTYVDTGDRVVVRDSDRNTQHLLIIDVPALQISDRMGRPTMDELEAVVGRAYDVLGHLVVRYYAERGLSGPTSIEMSQELVLEERIPEAASA